jgi:hypothetical protein
MAAANTLQADTEPNAPDDSRRETRQRAAELIERLLNETDRAEPSASLLERYLETCSHTIEVLGPQSVLTERISEAATRRHGAETEDVRSSLRSLRDVLSDVCDALRFEPIMEAERPRGFPGPTPVEDIELKRYPSYRMARTEADSGGAFWTLFLHIKKNDIAMTAPVELGYGPADASRPRQASMAFLYGDRELGTTGRMGNVRVVDVPAMTVVSIGIRGPRTPDKLTSARDRLVDWLDAHGDRFTAAGELRVMGYNSPFVPPKRSYFEVQIPVREIQHAGSE